MFWIEGSKIRKYYVHDHASQTWEGYLLLSFLFPTSFPPATKDKYHWNIQIVSRNAKLLLSIVPIHWLLDKIPDTWHLGKYSAVCFQAEDRNCLDSATVYPEYQIYFTRLLNTGSTDMYTYPVLWRAKRKFSKLLQPTPSGTNITTISQGRSLFVIGCLMLLYQLHRQSSRELGNESWYLGRMLKEIVTALP